MRKQENIILTEKHPSRRPGCAVDTHLSFLLVEIVNDDADEEVEREEGAENDEDDKVQVHVEVDFSDRLFLHLKERGSYSVTMASTSAWYDLRQSYSLLSNQRLRA